MKGGKMNDYANKGSEVDALNVTFDSIDQGARTYQDKYRGEFNKPVPKFRGLPRDYYPTTCASCCQSCGMILVIYVVCAALFMGLLIWGLHDSKIVGWVSFGVFMLYLVLIVTMVYFGSAERKKKERTFINAKIK